jgi:RNA-directed DNA polymerase
VVKGERHHAEALLDEVAEVIAPLGLRLAPDKTRVVHIDDGFDFLGHTIVRRVKRGTSKTYVFTFPSAKAMQAIRDRTRELTKSRSTLYMDLDEVLLRLTRSATGLGELLPARLLKPPLPADRLSRLEAHRRLDPPEASSHLLG